MAVAAAPEASADATVAMFNFLSGDMWLTPSPEKDTASEVFFFAGIHAE